MINFVKQNITYSDANYICHYDIYIYELEET